MIKWPAIGTIVSEALNTFKRFPGVLLCAIIGAFALSHQLNVQLDENNWLIYLIFTCSLGAVLFFNAYLYFERNKIAGRDKYLYSVLIVIALVIYYFLQPEELNRISIVRFALINLGLHLMVSFVAFVNFDEPNGFWHFNQRIFIRLFISFFYSMVLYAGAALALVTIDYLFDVSFTSDNYLRTFYFIFIIFNSWVFLNGIPSTIQELEKDESFPRLLKFFSQFVLLPLVTVYIIILYAYVVRLFIIGSAPDTNVAYMVLALAIAGILALLLVWPMHKSENYKWLKVYQKTFYVILIPLIILFFVAIWHRVRDYGITENRYFVLVLALWLFGIAVYFIFSKKKSIKVIPTSLCAIVFLSSFGPWGAIKFSRVSQLMRFETILNNNNLLVEGKAIKSIDGISTEESDQLYSVTTYLVDVFGLNVLQPYFDKNLDSLSTIDSSNNYSAVSLILKQLNIENIQYGFGNKTENYFNIRTVTAEGFDLESYVKMYEVAYHEYGKPEVEREILYSGNRINSSMAINPLRIEVDVNGVKDVEILMEDSIHDLQSLNREELSNLDSKLLSFVMSGAKYKYKVVIKDANGLISNKKVLKISNMNYLLFIGEK